MDIQSMIDNYKSDYLWTEDHEKSVISILEDKNCVRDRQYYHIKKNFKIVSVGGIRKVSRINNEKIMATRKNVLSIVKDLHIACGHKGEKNTHKKVSEHYANIPISIVKMFIQQCKTCSEKTKKFSQAGVDICPITVSDLNRRGQINLIDFQDLVDGDFKFILHYKEHLTKYNFLRPLTSKNTVEIAKELLNIFLNFGPPFVLQSDSGSEFIAGVIQELGSLWPDLVLINGRSRHPKSQKSDQAVKDSLIAWMRDHNISSWTTGLLFVQWRMNTTYHEAVHMDPYKAVFGQQPKICLRSKIPQEFLELINNGMLEEDIEDIINIDNLKLVNVEILELEDDSVISLESKNHFTKSNPSHLITGIKEDFHSDGDCSSGENIIPNESENKNLVSHPTVESRKVAAENLLFQADNMIKRIKKEMPPLKDHVLVGISQFDKGNGDKDNPIGVILKTEKD